MIYLTGDLHGELDIHKLGSKNFPITKESLTKEVYVIILGDFGLIWHPEGVEGYRSDKHWLKWLDEKPFTTLFVDGNHENHPMLYDLEQVEMFGSIVGKVNDSVFHLKRGEVYEIDDEKFFVMGGASSIDKLSRIDGMSWWKEEIPSVKEFEHGLFNLEKNDWKVDYILGHTGPDSICKEYLLSLGLSESDKIDDPVGKYFDKVVDRIEFRRFLFGHWHDNWVSDCKKYFMLYDKIINLGDIR